MQTTKFIILGLFLFGLLVASTLAQNPGGTQQQAGVGTESVLGGPNLTPGVASIGQQHYDGIKKACDGFWKKDDGKKDDGFKKLVIEFEWNFFFIIL